MPYFAFGSETAWVFRMRAIKLSVRVAAILALIYGSAAQAEVSAADQAAIQGVIGKQLDAFRHDDSGAAFSYATPELQTMFGSAARFMAMVQQQYRPVYRPRTVEFGTLSDAAGEVVQSVELIGPDGLAYTARYTMQRQPNGGWRIGACELLASRRVGT